MSLKEQRCLLVSDCIRSSLCAPEGEPVMLLFHESGCFWTKRGEKAIDPRVREERGGAGSATCNLLME